MKIIAIVAAAALLSGTTFGQVRNDSYWSDSLGCTAHVDVVDTPGPGVTITVTDPTGSTPATPGTAAAGSTTDDPSCSSAANPNGVETNSPEPNEYRIKDGKLQKKNASGKWVNMRKTRKPKASLPSSHGSQAAPGEEGSSLPDPFAPQAL